MQLAEVQREVQRALAADDASRDAQAKASSCRVARQSVSMLVVDVERYHETIEAAAPCVCAALNRRALGLGASRGYACSR